MRFLFAALVAIAAAALPAATFTVTNLNDSGAGSLRQGMLDAEAAAGSDIVAFDSNLTGTVTLASPLPDITTAMHLFCGSIGSVTVSGANLYTVFTVRDGGIANFTGLIISNGLATTGAATGGAIHIELAGTVCDVTLTRCVIRDSDADNGGAIGVDGTGSGSIFLTCNGCSFLDNTAVDDGGALGLLYSGTDVYCTNCTFSGNSAVLAGSAVSSSASALVYLTNCTVAGNTGAPAVDRGAGSIWLAGCIVAGNTADVEGVLWSLDGNVIGDATNATITAQSGDQFGTTASPINPLLLTLADHGGGIPTYALDNASPAVDAGWSSSAPSEDQRGYTRVDDPDCGSFELLPPQLSVEQAAGSIPANSNVFLTGTATPGVGRVETFTIRNLAPAGEKNLQVIAIYNGGTSNCAFAVTTTPAATVIPNGTTTLEVTVTPTATGLYWFTLFIDTNDPSSWSYSITLIGAADSPVVVTNGSDGGGDEGCSTGHGGGPVWLTLLSVLAVAALRPRQSTNE